MKKPLVTIITPAYNCASFIRETIESVQSQDYKNIRYLVIDDGSTDNTADIITEMAVDMFTTGPNKGEQATVNEAFKNVKGKYFMVVNADDPLLPGAVSKLVAFMEAHPDIVCAYPDWNTIDENGTIRRHVKSLDYDFKYMVEHNTCLPSVGSLVRAGVLKDKAIRRDETYRWLGDFVFWLRLALAGPMAHVPLTLAQWRVHDGQASGDKSDARAQEHIRIMYEFFTWENIPADINKGKAHCWADLVAAVVTDSKMKAIRYILAAFLHKPSILLSIEFWDIVRRRALHYFRR